jgi:hypothetical protein
MLRSNLLRFGLITLSLSWLALAQDQQPATPQPSTQAGGWRRVGDPPPPAQGQDPAEPVDRSDAYGQPAGQQGQPEAPMPPQIQAPPQSETQTPPPAPRRTRPAYGLPPEVVLQPGTYVTIRTNQPLTTDHSQPGDSYSGTLMQPVVVDGIVVAQRGQMVYGRVAEVQRQHADRPSRLGLELTSLTLADGTQLPIRSQLIARQGGRTPAGDQVGTVAATTGAGAMIGGAVGWGTGAAIGAGIGAVAGMIGVIATRNHATVVYPETPLTFRIESPATISTTRAPQAFRYVGPDEYDRPVQAQLQPRPAPPRGAYYGPGYAYPYPSYPYYWGPGFSVYWGPGFFYGRGYYGRGYYRRWR